MSRFVLLRCGPAIDSFVPPVEDPITTEDGQDITTEGGDVLVTE